MAVDVGAKICSISDQRLIYCWDHSNVYLSAGRIENHYKGELEIEYIPDKIKISDKVFCTISNECVIYCAHLDNMNNGFFIAGEYQMLSLIDTVVCTINLNMRLTCYNLI